MAMAMAMALAMAAHGVFELIYVFGFGSFLVELLLYVTLYRYGRLHLLTGTTVDLHRNQRPSWLWKVLWLPGYRSPFAASIAKIPSISASSSTVNTTSFAAMF